MEQIHLETVNAAVQKRETR